MELSKKEKDMRKFQRHVTKWLKLFIEGCDKIERLAEAIEKLNIILDKTDRRLDYSGNERKDISKKI